MCNLLYLQACLNLNCLMDKEAVSLKPGRPRHEQVSTWIRSQIEHGSLGVDDQLPSESQLGKQFSVSRITVRRALQTLESEGLIYKRQGLGSFVRGTQVNQGLVRLTDFVEDMSAAGIRATSKVIALEPEPASAKIARALEVEEGQQVVRLDRLRFGDDEPVAFDTTWLPVMFAQLLSSGDLNKESIYTILERDYDIHICRGRFRIEAVNAPNDIAGHLNIPWGRALLLIERTSFTERANPVYLQLRYYRCDRVAYEMELDRDCLPHRRDSSSLPLREFEPVFKR